MRQRLMRRWMILVGAIPLAAAGPGQAQTTATIRQALLGESSQPTAEISTDELVRILRQGSATVLDARPHREYAVSHIPGARNVAPKPGVSPSAYVSDVAEIGRLVNADHSAPIVLYCNGPQCGKSKRLASELVAAGYRNVRRYQLGIPVWRALGEVCETEAEGLRYIVENDKTAVIIDARAAGEFAAGSVPTARNVPRDLVLPGKDTGEVRRAKDDGRLPMEDHNTRIVVLGADARTARYVAEAIAREAFHNVSYFPGSFEDAVTGLGRQ
ncbi:MAG TPA: rhodanese-like domain-containing protein [Gemmatimonadales bacterium]|nr:rhodanese-like domain-containing protein [Gemmatimonadales bacterium]